MIRQSLCQSLLGIRLPRHQRRLLHVGNRKPNTSRLLRHKRVLFAKQERQFVSAVASVARHLLKLRYFVATGVIGGSVAAKNWYEDWKSGLPDFSLPEWAKFDDLPALRDFAAQMRVVSDSWGAEGHEKLAQWRLRFENLRRDHERGIPLLRETLGSVPSHRPVARLVEAGNVLRKSGSDNSSSSPDGESRGFLSFFSRPSESDEESEDKQISADERLVKLQEEMLKTQSQYQRELERLEKENKVLKQRILLADSGAATRLKRLKRSLIDMYSEVLDILNEYDSSYSTADNLPRVVVIGDQSAGKTSVLEMIAQARLFPRGSGEMMTRAPVKVTLSGGPFHVAQFRDSTREFDLTSEAELKQLRAEIEVRMRNSVKEGSSVSNDVISLTVKGPNLPRMVLVDLPGVISTVTADMAKNTKKRIIQMCRQYMENPNAIILCIQDGSVDAERSNVTDLVSSIDPDGLRTILVLTKVDLAEANLANPERIKKILEGKLFPMKALGYFGVVTGRGNSNESIEDIRKYEEQFFSKSQLLRDGVLKPSQVTTRNMSFAVSECFWRMVRDSVESQADAFRATRFNLETEWKNTFPRLRQLDRDELFDKARTEILDELVNLSLVEPEEWERNLEKKLWKSVAPHIFDQVLLPASGEESSGSFNTFVDIRLKQWVEKELGLKSIQTGWETQRELFSSRMVSDSPPSSRTDDDQLFEPIKTAVVSEAMKEHTWDNKALDYLRAIQLNAIEDRAITERRAWDSACNFMYKAATDRLRDVQEELNRLRGPGFWGKWFKWKTPTLDEHLAGAVQDEAISLLNAQPEHKMALSSDDLTVMKCNLESKGIVDVPPEVMRQQWRLVYKKHFLEKLSMTSSECKGLYQHYRQGEADLDCESVVLFHRLHKMLRLSCNALRQQITNTEQRRLEKEVKDLLDDWSADNAKKKELLGGKRVELAEQIKQVKHVQEKLEAFIQEMHREKRH